MHYVYILRSIPYPSEIYTGVTDDFRHRIKQHNAGQPTYSRKFLPWSLAFYAAFPTRPLAEHFEKYLKCGSGRAFARKRLFPNQTKS